MTTRMRGSLPFRPAVLISWQNLTIYYLVGERRGAGRLCDFTGRAHRIYTLRGREYNWTMHFYDTPKSTTGTIAA
jgi:hypothetical protein